MSRDRSKSACGSEDARIGDGFIKENIQRLAGALAAKMLDEDACGSGIIIGYGCGFLSRESAIWASEIFAAEDIPVFLGDEPLPAPAVMLYVRRHNFPYGLMITDGRRSFQAGGVKVYDSDGREADEFLTKEIELYLSEMECIPDASVSNDQEGTAAGLIREFDPMKEYLGYLSAQINLELVSRHRPKIVLDQVRNPGSTVVHKLLSSAGCEPEVISQGAGTLQELRKYTREKVCDFGFMMCSDTDGIGVFDDRGRYLDSNTILVILYHCLLTYRGWKGSVVRNVITTHRLDRVAAAFGEKSYEVPVGTKYIAGKMKETNAIVGGEAYGGIMVRGHVPGNDRIYAALLLVELASESGKKLSALAEETEVAYGITVTKAMEYTIRSGRQGFFRQLLLIDRLIPEFPVLMERISYLDGCQIIFQNKSWIAVRFLKAEPLLRIYCEAQDAAEAAMLCQCFVLFLSEMENSFIEIAE